MDVTFHEFDGAVDVSSVPIGRPVFNTRVLVLDSRLRVVPVGMVGELYLAGVQLARGYHGRAELTADRFVADPFDSAGGGRLYRTGDVVRWSAEGELEYVGRSDFQVKLRGLRIELGEIESALLAESVVAQAVVLVRHDQLVAYVVPSAGFSVDVGVLELSVAGVLPGYMVPSAFVVLDGFPLSAAGKLDRRALPDPVFVVREFREPVSEVECVVAGVFADVLGVSGVGLDDDFFALGGNSLIATQVVSRIGAALDASVPVRALFDATTVETFANAVAALAGTGGRPALVTETRPDRIPLSLAQQRMWFLDKFEPNSAAYNIPIVVRLQGDLDFETLSKAIDDVRERHESLRTIYPEIDGVGHQVVVPLQANSFELGFDECTEIEALERIKTLVTRGFTLAQSAPFRAHLYRLGDAENLLAVVVHHIAADGFSMGPLVARHRHRIFGEVLRNAAAVAAAGGPVCGLRCVATGYARRRNRSRVRHEQADSLLDFSARRCARTTGSADRSTAAHARHRTRCCAFLRCQCSSASIDRGAGTRTRVHPVHGRACRVRGTPGSVVQYRGRHYRYSDSRPR